jgi:L-asparaginase/Glu-tRNA(Gln) amidotransferase subunit D
VAFDVEVTVERTGGTIAKTVERTDGSSDDGSERFAPI